MDENIIVKDFFSSQTYIFSSIRKAFFPPSLKKYTKVGGRPHEKATKEWAIGR